MKRLNLLFFRLLLTVSGLTFLSAVQAADLAEIQARGELRHLGIRYANFVTGAGDGFDVELTQGFAKHLGVKYTLVYTDFYSVIRDLLGKNVVIADGQVRLEGDFPIKGDMIATGFTYLPWRAKVLLYSEPTFPSQVMLIARADSALTPIKDSADLRRDIVETKKLIGAQSLLVIRTTVSQRDAANLSNVTRNSHCQKPSQAGSGVGHLTRTFRSNQRPVSAHHPTHRPRGWAWVPARSHTPPARR